MGGESTGEITEKFSSRLSILLGDNPQARKYLYDRAKYLYNKRSKVIHSGSTNIELSDVLEMENLMLNVLIKMASRLSEWKKHEDFVTWYDKARWDK